MITLATLFIIPVEKRHYGLQQDSLTTDYTGLLPQKVQAIERAKNRQQLVDLVKLANKEGKKLSIAGVQHSQGGHTYYKDAIVIDMKSFNRILEVNREKKQVTVEAGALISDVQTAVAKQGLAMKVTQSLPIFTVGGSLSVNGHGRDIRHGSMASTVAKMTIITPTGQLKELHRQTDKKEMSYILGGYGLFGIIIDVTFDVVDDTIYRYESQEMNVRNYENYLKKVLATPTIAMHYARLSVDPKHFLDEMYVMNYIDTAKKPLIEPLKEESLVHLSKWGLDVGRQGGKWETAFWAMQKKLFAYQSGKTITRNNAMRSESTFMEYTKLGSVEVLQEFFIPIDEFDEFVADLKKWIPQDDKNEEVKLHNITLRIVSNDESTALNYAKEPMIAFVLLIQHPTSDQGIEAAKSFIQQWTDAALLHRGTYYLPYYPYQTLAQFEAAYPHAKDSKKMKLLQDPNEVFYNNFYKNYLQQVNQ
ncbi:FAD-binding oxidoreductase [Kurthia sibirica]|uniref:FAD-binding oxidoreductase n=1 Tax=Kurthia sibirica TaxID=202750 RepID=A0A2U3APC5_9BACL|nr:FAD-binding oxidoreductase [Kurthia sibirica]PWI26305.1 FAD-binding oxidoreductase [Kurthia sibirica]GEK35026.1 L-gulonolactone oxidase [Kurthia sibirica]